MALHECVSQILEQCEIDANVSGKLIVGVRDLEAKVDRINDMLERIAKIVEDHSALLIGKRSNGEYDFGLIFKYKQIERELKIIRIGVWTIAAALLVGVAKLLIFGGF